MPEYNARLCSISVDTSLVNDRRAAIYLHFRRNNDYFRYARIGEVAQIRAFHKQLEFDKLYRIQTKDNIHIINIKEVEGESKIQAKNLSSMRKKVFSDKPGAENR